MLVLETAIDAKHDYTVKLGTKSSARACRHLKLREPGDCFGARVVRYEDPNVEDILVWLTVTFIKFYNEPVAWKFQNSPEMRKIAEINDLQGKRGMIQALRIIQSIFGVQEVKLYVPRWGLSYERTRSEEHKERKRKREAELTAQPGRKKKRRKQPQGIGLRSGTGLAHWTKEVAV
jgi:hypothetical protein